MRWFRLLLGTLLLVGTLSACSPKPLSTVAVLVRDGQPTVVLVTCVGVFSQLSVYEDDPDVQPRPTEDVLVSWGVDGDADTEIVEVAVFGEPPAGWKTDREHRVGDPNQPGSFMVEPLLELVPGVRYAAAGSGSRDSYPVDFTTADLDRLEDGHVLAWGAHGETKTLTYDNFVARARDGRGDCPRH